MEGQKKKLVIVESPAKAKTINRMLGPDYVVKSSMGHIRDLPVKSLGVDVEKGFRPKYVLVPGRKKIASELKKACEQSSAVYLAPDPDREGEAIAWHLKAILEEASPDMEFKRVQYNQITADAVRHAFENPGTIDMNRVDAQQARRILDRIVGYKVSPMLWRRIRRGLSAGRVQSVALRLVCEREAEIRAFVPEEYWVIGATLRKLVSPLDPFKAKLVKIEGENAEVGAGEDAARIRVDLEDSAMKVSGVRLRTISKQAPPPHITSTLQQAASTHHSFSPSRTMSVAQKLYEGVDLGDGPAGLITYMRTDSFSLAKEAVDACRDMIRSRLGEEYCPEKPRVFKSRSGAQEAHEAIRPTDVTRTPESLASRLGPAELKVYGLIWRRFVASQMSAARIDQRSVDIEATPKEGTGRSYGLSASVSEVVFPGYMKIAGQAGTEKKEGEEEIDALPPLEEGEPLECLDVETEQKETKPPPRYSEASLVKALEANGIGRPSTYAQILSTLNRRKYITRDRRALLPTELGISVSDLLVEKLGSLFAVEFTASMEAALDEVERGKTEWTTMLGVFHRQFEEWMSATKEPPADTAAVKSLLQGMECVTEWAPPVQRGKHKYDDKKFVSSIQSQIEAGRKEVSTRQLRALLKVATRYRDTVEPVARALAETGLDQMIETHDTELPKESSVRKLELMASLDLEESAKDFVDSLRARVDSGRRLSDAQARALNGMVLSRSGAIGGFAEIRDALELGDAEVTEDAESGPLLEAMSHVVSWHPPVTKGRRVFNDAGFYESLSNHFAARGSLSPRQRSALKRLVRRYREQVPGYEELEEKFELGKGGKRSAG